MYIKRESKERSFLTHTMAKRKSVTAKQRFSNTDPRLEQHQGMEESVYSDYARETRKMPDAVIAMLAADAPDIFLEDVLKKVTASPLNGESLSFEESPELVDEQIKNITAYIRAHEDSFQELPQLPREALRMLVTLRKYLHPEEIVRIEDRIFESLRKKYGWFDESALIMFLVKYLL